MELIERFRGCLSGLAAGDALGTTLEFQPPGSFRPQEEMVGGGPFNLEAGQWTDDTAMALCLAESLIEYQGFNPADQMKRYLHWYRHGHLSSTGACFDIGNTVRNALERFEITGEPFSGSTDPYTAGNGSLMRLAPVPMFFSHRPVDAISYCGESSRTTHGARTAVDACRYFGGLLVGAFMGAGKQDMLSDRFSIYGGCWQEFPLVEEIDMIAQGSFRRKMPPEIRGSGYVVHSLEAALWAFYHSESFEQGCLMAVNLGEDADTTGAVFGQLGGAYYGEQNIPVRWRNKLALKELIREFADQLYEIAPALN